MDTRCLRIAHLPIITAGIIICGCLCSIRGEGFNLEVEPAAGFQLADTSIGNHFFLLGNCLPSLEQTLSKNWRSILGGEFAGAAYLQGYPDYSLSGKLGAIGDWAPHEARLGFSAGFFHQPGFAEPDQPIEYSLVSATAEFRKNGPYFFSASYGLDLLDEMNSERKDLKHSIRCKLAYKANPVYAPSIKFGFSFNGSDAGGYSYREAIISPGLTIVAGKTIALGLLHASLRRYDAILANSGNSALALKKELAVPAGKKSGFSHGIGSTFLSAALSVSRQLTDHFDVNAYYDGLGFFSPGNPAAYSHRLYFSISWHLQNT
jgi:hypothetical protein